METGDGADNQNKTVQNKMYKQNNFLRHVFFVRRLRLDNLWY